MDRPTAADPPEGDDPGAPSDVPDAPPTLPSRTAFLLAFSGIVVAGVLGGIIGFGLGDLSSERSTAVPLAGAVIGALVAAGGVGVVAVLVLRAQAEWRRVPPAVPGEAAPRDPPTGRPGR